MWKLSAQVTGEVLITQYVLLRHGEAKWWALRTKILFRFVHLRHHFSVAIEVSEIGFFYQEEVVSETNHPPRLFPNCL